MVAFVSVERSFIKCQTIDVKRRLFSGVNYLLCQKTVLFRTN
jgi:hypothetical protein